MDDPKVSIITASYNSGRHIGKTIDSVKSQSYENLEHVIVDGNSKDNTLDVIEDKVWSGLTYISEEDSGIYNAINKGLALSTGDLILILNSDDYLEKDVIPKIVKEFTVNVDFTYGSVIFLEKKGDRMIAPMEKINVSNLQSMPFPHISLCVRREVVESLNGYSEGYSIAGDFDFIVRMLLKGYRGKNLNRVIGYALEGGVSDSFESARESYSIVIKYGKPKHLAMLKLVEFWLKYQIRRYMPRVIFEILLKFTGSRYAPK